MTMLKIYSPSEGIIYRHPPRKPKRNPVVEKVEKMYWTIGEVAEILNITTSAIRFRCMELNIQTARGSGKRRKFTAEQVAKLRLVNDMINDGVHLWKIKETLSDKKTTSEYGMDKR